ncbi:MAG: CheR family methyltransferase [Gemmatimonadaceae bacterium]
MSRPSKSGTPRRDGWSHPALAWVVDVLRDRYGLVFPLSRQQDVEQAMLRAMEKRGITDAGKWRDIITHNAEPLDDVIAELTIGETYFFRDPAQLDVVRDVVLPAAARQHPQRPLRIWSAGCATGEEPYSLAMLLRETDWQTNVHPVHIVGTDLSVVRLAAARRGQYGAWSFRGMAEERRQRFFEPRGRQWLLDPGIRSMVEFRLLNLAEDEYPEPATGIFGMDIIFCRNVLIYFDMQTVTKVATGLINSLSDDGWLFLGPSDPPLNDLVPCEVVTTPAGLVYRRPGVRGRTSLPHVSPPSKAAAKRATTSATTSAAKAAPLHAPSKPLTPPSPTPVQPVSNLAAQVLAAYAEGRYDDAAELAKQSVQHGVAAEEVWSAWVRALANEGRLLEAAAVCSSALDRHGASAELTYLESVLLAQTGRYAESAVAARRSLYLDRTLVVAHLALGDALSRSGDPAGAARSFRNAEHILSTLDPNTTVRGTDGETAARLIQIARYRAAALKDVVA